MAGYRAKPRRTGLSHKLEAVHARHLDIDDEEAVATIVSLRECIRGETARSNLVARRFQDALLQHSGRQRVIDDKDRRPPRVGFLGVTPRPRSAAATRPPGSTQVEVALGIQRCAQDHWIGLDHAGKRPHHDVGGAQQPVHSNRDAPEPGLDDHGRPDATVPAGGARAPEQYGRAARRK